MAKEQVLGFKPTNKSMMNIPSECRIESIGLNHAMILPHDAIPGRMEFSERTGSPARIGPSLRNNRQS
jgi:hypothetical protein